MVVPPLRGRPRYSAGGRYIWQTAARRHVRFGPLQQAAAVDFRFAPLATEVRVASNRCQNGSEEP